MKNKNILICIAGLTPQIITESLYCLSVQKKIMIDEIVIVTTKKGKDVILGKDKDPKTPKVSLKNEIKNLAKLYKIKPPIFDESNNNIIVANEESLDLFDIRNDKQNKLFPNKLAKLLKEKTEDNKSVLHCVLSGGRKSMTAHFALVLSLFGREHDKLYHVLTKEKFEFKDFYPKTKEERNALEISEIPFIRLRGLLGDKLLSNEPYTDLVEWTQKQLKILTGNYILLKINSKEIQYENKILKLRPLFFSIYHQFALSKCEGQKSIIITKSTVDDFSSSVLEFIKNNYDYYFIKDKNNTKYFTIENFRSLMSKINKKIAEHIPDSETAELFKISSFREYGNTSYGIKAGKSRIKISF